MLGRRGEDHRFEAPRPAAQRRRDRDAERDDARREFDEFNPLLIRPRPRTRSVPAAETPGRTGHRVP